MTGVPVDEATAPDFIMVRAALVRRLGGTSPAFVWSRIHYRCAEAGYNRVEDPTGRWWSATQAVIAEETGMTLDAVRHAIKGLTDGGYIESKRHQQGGNYDRTRSYRVLLSDPSSGTSPGCTRDAPQAGYIPDEEAGYVPLHSLEENLGEVVHASSATTQEPTPRKKTKWADRESDDETTSDSSDQPRPLGAPPRKTTQEAKDIAESRGTSGNGLALRFQRGMDASGAVGNHTDVSILRGKINEMHLKKVPWPVLAEMVRLFTENPSAYTPPGSSRKAWVQFLASSETLRVHATRIVDTQHPQNEMTPEEDDAWQREQHLGVYETEQDRAEREAKYKAGSDRVRELSKKRRQAEIRARRIEED